MEMPSIKYNTITFIKAAQAIHGNEYDYSEAIYKTMADQLIIGCRIHGIFYVTPTIHLSGHKCKKCANDLRVKNREVYFNKSLEKRKQKFIEKAIVIHGDKYNYSDTIYRSAKEKISIFCNHHNKFFNQTPSDHLSGNGCQDCGFESRSKSRTGDTYTFVEKAKLVHNDKYNYDESVFSKSHENIKIICPDHGAFLQKASNHLSGFGCIKCAGTQAKNTSSFIEEAKTVHGNKYDYSSVNYINIDTKIKIICKIHEEFNQTPHHHLKGQGCKLCAIDKNAEENKITKEEFLKAANEKFEFKYSYNESDYIDYRSQIKIICPISDHGSFWQTPLQHLTTNGCSKCSKKYKMSNKEYIEKVKKIHGDKYDYSSTNFISMKNKIKYLCKKCGNINEQLAGGHAGGKTCGHCAGRFTTTEDFIRKAKLIHNDNYDYTNVEYITNKDSVLIACRKHGDFEQRADHHLGGSGCPNCISSFSFVENEWLDILDIANRQQRLKINDYERKRNVDGYDPLNKIVYEFHGDFFHAHPTCSSCFNREKIHPNKINTKKQKTNAQIYADTLYREQKIKETGYKLVVIWEHEFNALKAMYGNDSQLFEEHVRSHAEYQLMYYNE